MFKLQDIDKSPFQEANDFYSYAKALAILRENYMRHRPVASSGIPTQIDEAISALIKQVQEEDMKSVTTSGEYVIESSKSWINPVKGEDAFIIDLPNGRKIKIDGMLESIEEVK